MEVKIFMTNLTNICFGVYCFIWICEMMKAKNSTEELKVLFKYALGFALMKAFPTVLTVISSHINY